MIGIPNFVVACPKMEGSVVVFWFCLNCLLAVAATTLIGSKLMNYIYTFYPATKAPGTPYNLFAMRFK